MFRDCLGQLFGELSMCRMEGKERQHCPVEVLDVFGLSLLPSLGICRLPLGKAFVERSTSSSLRIRSIVAAGAHTPCENTLRPFFSATAQ